MTKLKSFAKKVALVAVDTIACPLHIGAQLGANICQLTADGIAMGEGYITEKIDNTKDRELVANARVEYTKQRFLATAMTLEAVNHKLQHSIDAANDKITEIKDKFSKPTEPVHTAEIVPVEHYQPAGELIFK